MVSENVVIPLFTWLDVEESLIRITQNEGWPSWLRYFRAYWDSLSLSVSPKYRDSAFKWLSEKFGHKYDNDNSRVLLESDEDPRFLLVNVEEDDEPLGETRFAPSFSRPTLLRRPPPMKEKVGEESKRKAGAASIEGRPYIIVFHSFKGGVGRTVHSLALALSLAEKEGFKVLLIDGDLEAPGLTWLFSREIRRPPISYTDFLALVHGDPDPAATQAIRLTAKHLRNASVDGIYIMPAFRSMDKFISMDIKPEHLVHFSKDPFRLTGLLSRLGSELGVNFIIVDLRAGLSEISASLLLDPMVYRILVTTLSGQSLHGTGLLLDLFARIAPSRRINEPLPALIISQVPVAIRVKYENGEPANELLEGLSFLQKIASDVMKPSDEDQNDTSNADVAEVGEAHIYNADETDNNKDPLLVYSITPFRDDLAVLPSDWKEALRHIRDSRLDERLIEILEWLPHPSTNFPQKELEEKRLKLDDYAGGLIYAETGEVTDFLKIRPLKRLSSEFSTKVPIAVVIGAKGSGKTFTFLQLARAKNWDKFTAEDSSNKSIDAAIVPVLKPKNLKDAAYSMVESAKEGAAQYLGLSKPCTFEEISEHIRNRLSEESHESHWRDNWLDCIAWSSGFEVMRQGAGKRFIDYLREKKLHLVAIVDGLEDQFLELTSNKQQQVALRSLLQDVPNWLEQQNSRPLGILIFIRKDMALGSLPQNASQFLAVYRNFELNWGSEEALRLFAWISMKAKVLDDRDINRLNDMSREDLVEKLISLWGRKLGGEDSREAISANWVIYALSDYNGQIQARDVVRFLHLSAKNSEGKSGWNDRILVPMAIRRSLHPCSLEKVKETKEENSELKRIFEKIEGMHPDKRQVPFHLNEIDLDSKDLEMLETNGVIRREGDEYYIPEIFRGGLGFILRKGARPNVLRMAMRAQRQRAN